MESENSIIFEATINDDSSSQVFDDLDSNSSNSSKDSPESNRIQEETRRALERHFNSSYFNNQVVDESVDDNSPHLNQNEMDTFKNSNSIFELVDLANKRVKQTENRCLIDLFSGMASKATNLIEIPGDEITLQLIISNFISNILIVVVNSLQLESCNKKKRFEDPNAVGQQKFAESIKKENVSKLSSTLANCLMNCDEKILAEKIERAFIDNINNSASIMFKNDYDASNFLQNIENNYALVIILK